MTAKKTTTKKTKNKPKKLVVFCTACTRQYIHDIRVDDNANIIKQQVCVHIILGDVI